jgi:hypothetical protein
MTTAGENVVPQSYHLIGNRQQREQRRLYTIAVALTAAAAVYLAVTAKVRDPIHLYQGLAIFILSLWPSLKWLQAGGSRFPVFEPIMALCAAAYAFPLLTGHEPTQFYPAETLTQAAWCVIAYQVTAILCYRYTRGRPGRARFWTESLLSDKTERAIVYAIVPSVLYMGISRFTTWIPADLESILRAIFFGLSILCIFVTSQRWGRGELPAMARVLFGFCFVLQVLILASGLLMISAICQLGIALLGYLSSARRVPWLVIGIAFVIIAVLHNGKAAMREIYWEGEKAPPSFVQLPSYFAEWIGHGLHQDEADEVKSVNRQLLERTSLFHIFCLVANRTPDFQPYLDGETYGYVLPQLIPRLLWPDKPRSHIGTYRLAIYYGLQDEEATETTTIAFGMLTESYANFGILGCIGLGAFFGIFLKKMQLWTAHSPMFSLGGLVMILLTAWSFNAEQTLAVWVSSLFQALVVVLGLPMIFKSLFSE